MATLLAPSAVTDTDPYVTFADAIQSARYHLEVIDGVPQEKPTPKQFHALIQAYLFLKLVPLFPKGHVLLNMDVLVGGSDFLVPDLLITGSEAKYKFGMLFSPAHLAVEIMSPGQTIGELFRKCERLHQAGHELCWVIWPKKRKAWTYRPEDLVEEHERLTVPLYGDTGESAMIPMDEMFAELDSWLAEGQ
jgi:Uma2 family endonuclease